MKPKYKLLSIIFLAVFLFGSNINSYPLKNWDEAWYGEISKNMALKGTGFLMPFWNGDYYFDKPPLYFWLTTLVVRIFGAGEWQMRIISVAAAIIATVAVYFIAKKLFNETSAFWSTLIFISFGQVIERFGSGNLDALMISLMLLSLFFYLNKKLFWAGVFVGLTALSKGIVFILYPLIVISLLELFKYKTLRLKLVLIPAVALGVVLPWFLLGIVNFGQKFVNVYLGDPLSGNLSWRGKGFSSILAFTLLRDTATFVVPAFIFLFLEIKSIKKSYLSVISILLGSSVIIFIPLNFFADKIGWYLLPIYPLLAIIAGFAFFQINKSHKYWLMVCLAAFAVQLLIHIHINRQAPDQSLISATLGREVKAYPLNLGEVILEDNNFTGFLYYSDIVKIRSLQSNTKPSEWWIISYEQFQKIIESHDLITLITKNHPNWEEKGFRSKQDLSFGFSLLQNY